MMERQTDYQLPDRFIANQKELLQVLHDKSARRIFANGEPMAQRTALEVNKLYLARLQQNTPEEQQDRVHRMPTLASRYAEIVSWVQDITASPDVLEEATGINNARHLAAEERAADPLDKPETGKRPRADNELSL